MKNKIEITQEKSQELADCINNIKIPLLYMDIEYAKAAAEQMIEQASFQDSAAVLNPMYNPEKSDTIRKQAKMLQHLISFIEIGKEVDEHKKSIANHSNQQEKIIKMFV